MTCARCGKEHPDPHPLLAQAMDLSAFLIRVTLKVLTERAKRDKTERPTDQVTILALLMAAYALAEENEFYRADTNERVPSAEVLAEGMAAAIDYLESPMDDHERLVVAPAPETVQ